MTRSHAFAMACLAAFAAAPPAPAVEPGGAEVSAAEDLLAVLKLRGRPCAAVAEHRRVAESDYEVRCSDGPRYRIRVDAEQRVVVEELASGAAEPGAAD